jgi:DNA replication protein DnaC
LCFFGPTRAGKTRAAWLLLKQLHFSGYTVRAMTATAFADAVALEYSQSMDNASRLIHNLYSCDVLFIDDFGKCKMTDRVETALFDVIDQRTSSLKPIILTTNFNGETLLQKLSADKGLPIVARIREFCAPISL